MNPSPSRLEHLVTQMKWRLEEGSGEAFYELGVEDNGILTGLNEADMQASLSTLEKMATRYACVNVCVRCTGVLTVFAHHRFANQSDGGRIIPSSLFARLANQYFGINEQSVTNKSFRNTRLFC